MFESRGMDNTIYNSLSCTKVKGSIHHSPKYVCAPDNPTPTKKGGAPSNSTVPVPCDVEQSYDVTCNHCTYKTSKGFATSCNFTKTSP